MSRVVLVSPDLRFERQVQFLVSEDMLVVSANDPDAFAERLSRIPQRPELVVFGSQIHRDHVLSLASAGRQYADSMAMVSDEQGILVDAMRAGISEVLPTAVDVDTIAAVLARTHDFALDTAAVSKSFPPVDNRPGRIIAVASPKGGVGKTTVACNLAVGLARSDADRVVLIDLDLQFGDVAASLGLEPHYFVDNAVAKSAARDSLVLKTFLTRHPKGFFVLCAPESPATADQITATQVSHLLGQLADEFRYVVVDTAPGLTELTLTVLEQATDVVAITSMDVSSVRGMRKELDVLAELGLLPESRHTVVNFAERSSGLTVADIETAIGARVDIVMPRTRAVGLATNRGNPVIIDEPRDRVARNLRLLVSRLETSSLTRKSWRQASRKEKVS